MRILIHSNSPWVPSGYGVQAGALGQELRALGHTVAFSAFHGLSGAPSQWDGFPVYPQGAFDFGVDVLLPHSQDFGADLIITLMDVWKLHPIADKIRQAQDRGMVRVAAWIPVDCTPLSEMDRRVLEATGIRPIAMTPWGQDVLEQAGFTAPLLMHGLDAETFRPPKDRAKLRRDLGIISPGSFLVGMCAANRDVVRKAFPEAMAAFRDLAREHAEAVLMMHTMERGPGGLDLGLMARQMGLEGRVVFSDTYLQLTGQFSPTMLAEWYSCLDVLLAPSYAEGFGIPVIEAQACGTPVITTGGTATDALNGHGWRAASAPYWNFMHGAWWRRPAPESITEALHSCYDMDRDSGAYEGLRGRCADFGATFAFDRVWGFGLLRNVLVEVTA